MKVIVLERIVKRIGVNEKNEERYEKAIKPICLQKNSHPSSYKKRRRKNPSSLEGLTEGIVLPIAG
jgi:hypothetical protein